MIMKCNGRFATETVPIMAGRIGSLSTGQDSAASGLDESGSFYDNVADVICGPGHVLKFSKTQWRPRTLKSNLLRKTRPPFSLFFFLLSLSL